MKIAFGYKMGSGKDKAVEYLINKYGGKQLSFASPIYEIKKHAQTVCGFLVEKDREFLQMMGDWARSKNRDVWVELLIQQVSDDCNIFVSDVRYLNEFKALKKAGFTCIKIVRESGDNREGTGSKSHNSEIELDQLDDNQWDFIIHNNKTLEDLYSKIDYIINE